MEESGEAAPLFVGENGNVTGAPPLALPFPLLDNEFTTFNLKQPAYFRLDDIFKLLAFTTAPDSTVLRLLQFTGAFQREHVVAGVVIAVFGEEKMRIA